MVPYFLKMLTKSYNSKALSQSLNQASISLLLKKAKDPLMWFIPTICHSAIYFFKSRLKTKRIVNPTNLSLGEQQILRPLVDLWMGTILHSYFFLFKICDRRWQSFQQWSISIFPNQRNGPIRNNDF